MSQEQALFTPAGREAMRRHLPPDCKPTATGFFDEGEGFEVSDQVALSILESKLGRALALCDDVERRLVEIMSISTREPYRRLLQQSKMIEVHDVLEQARENAKRELPASKP